jgi:hypothetical protein
MTEGNSYLKNSESFEVLEGKLEGFIPFSTFDLIIIPFGLSSIYHKKRLFNRLKKGLKQHGTIAFCMPMQLEKTLLAPVIDLMKNPKWHLVYKPKNLQTLLELNEELITEVLDGFSILHEKDIERKIFIQGAGARRLLYKWKMAEVLEKGHSLDHTPLIERFWRLYHDKQVRTYGTLEPAWGVNLPLQWKVIVARKN